MKGGHGGGVVATVLGIVEFENGDVMRVHPEEITFDDGGMFGQYVFFSDIKKGEA